VTPRLPRRLDGLPREVWVLVGGILITRAGSFAVPFLTIYLHRERGLSLGAAGIALAAYGAGGMVAALSGGSLADRLGRKPVVVGSPVLGGLAVVGLLATQAAVAVVAVSFVAGAVSEAGRPAVSAMLTDLTPYERRIDAFALFRLAINLGFAVGTGLGGLLITRYGFARLFVADAATSWIYAAIALALLVETRPARAPETADHLPRGFGAVLADRVFRRFWLGTFIGGLVFCQPMATLALALTDRGMSTAVYGALISANGVIIITSEFWISGRSRRFPPPKVMALGSLLLGAGFALTPLAGRAIPVLLGTVAVWTLGEMLGSPTSQAYVSAIAPPDLRGRYAGGVGLAWSLAFTIGPFLGALALSAGGPLLWLGSLALATVSAALFLSLPLPETPPALVPPERPVQRRRHLGRDRVLVDRS
jgi:predicted MFS family arabinose efflux permease